MENGKWEIPALHFFIFHYQFSIINFLALCLCVSVVNLSCGSRPTDLRTVIPADSLVYLETNDLGNALKAVTDNDAFKAAAKSVPDLSALNGMKLSVAVTGFQTTEQPVTEENSVLDFKPRFVGVVETNAWNYQALSFTENKLGEFINETYGGEVTLGTSDKNGGKYFVWTARDGRKAYALVRGSLIFFGNDESAIDKCLAVIRGEADSIAKNPKIAELSTDSLASGYVSTDGVAQIANIAGISLAMDAGEEGEARSFIARVLPEILRNSLTDLTWTAAKTERGIDDNYVINTNPEVAAVLKETLVPANTGAGNLAEFVPPTVFSATRYNVGNLQIAWQSILLIAQKQTDAVSGNLIATFSGSLFEPYGIENPELFLSAAGPEIVTVRFDAEGENSVVIAAVKDAAKAKTALAKEIFAQPWDINGNMQFGSQSKDGELAALIIGNVIISGDTEGVKKCVSAKDSGESISKNARFAPFTASGAVAVTIGAEPDVAGKIVDVIGERKDENQQSPVSYLTETRFNQNGIERRTVSDFGLIGSIIEQLGKE